MAQTIQIAGDQVQDAVLTEAKFTAAVKARAVECLAPVDAGGAVVYSTGAEGKVEALGTPGMAVQVATGGNAYNELGARITVPTTASLAISAADPTNPRYDVVVCDASGALAVREGTPGASPSEPSLTAGDVKLAVVKVAAADTQIDAGDIFDHRRWSNPEPRDEAAQGDDATTKFDLGYHAWGTVHVTRNGADIERVASGPSTVDEYTVTKLATEASGTRIEFGVAPASSDRLKFKFVA